MPRRAGNQTSCCCAPNDDAERKAARPFRQTADRVAGFLASWRQEASRKPFFLYVADPSPHDPRLAPWPRTSGEIRRHLRDYYAVTTHMDEQIGRVLRKLKAIGEHDNTIIVSASDQGLAVGSHRLMGKQNLYEHSMRPGMIVAGPGMRSRNGSGTACRFGWRIRGRAMSGSSSSRESSGGKGNGRRASVDAAAVAVSGIEFLVRTPSADPW